MAKQTKTATPKQAAKKKAPAAKKTVVKPIKGAVEETFTLPVSKGKCERRAFKGKHIREALKVADGDTSLTPYAMIAQTITVDGKNIFAEDIDEMDGRDAMVLLQKVGSFL